MSRAVSNWLFFCAAAVFGMAIVGAITRLTESGLSITEWSPVMGAIPPLNDADWSHAFSLYQQTPQFKQVNFTMSLDEFRQIYFWEWLHRLIGRLIGVIYALPLLWFWLRGHIPAGKKLSLLGILLLGFVQGLMGWYMVKSGLIDQPAVSHYRLAAHLGLALLIFCALIYAGLSFRTPPAGNSGLRGSVIITFLLTVMTVFWGVLVAGLRAGLIYNNNFPFMGKHLWPSEMFRYDPWWINFFENHAAVQFTHRTLAVLSFMSVILLVRAAEKAGQSSHLFTALLLTACVQVALGITTLLTGVNIAAATLHQAGAMTLLALLTAILYHTRHEA